MAAYFGGAYITSKFIESRGTVADQGYETETKQIRESVSGQENELTISDSQGEVVIDATLIPEDSSKDGLVFEIVMNTHSVDLTQYDLTKISTLSFGSEGRASENFTWEPSSTDSHHIKGFLKWSGSVPKNSSLIQLELKDIDQVTSRIFAWKQKNTIKQILAK